MDVFRKIPFGNVSRFAIIGVIGFFVDASLLKLYMAWINNDPILGRAVSFPVAATVTWLLNRQYTFLSGNKKIKSVYREWGMYMLVNSVGAGVNILVFLSMIFFINEARVYPVITLGVASFIAMFYNYFSSKYLVFQT